MAVLTNFIFTDGRPSLSYRAELERRAVLWSLMPGVRRQNPDAPATRRAIVRLIYEWRARVSAMQEFGWPPPRKFGSYADGLVYLQNCQPAFHWFRQETRTCKYDRICPFCYARRIGKLWPLFTESLPTAVEPSREGGRMRAIQLEETAPVVSAYHLVERRNTARIPFLSGTGGDISDPAVVAAMSARLRDFLVSRIRERSDKLPELRPLGSYSQITIEPRAADWRYRIRQIYIVRHDDNIETRLPVPARGVVFRHTKPTRATLMQVLAATCRYPVGMFRGNPLLTSIILKASAGLRLHATTGVLRHKRESDD